MKTPGGADTNIAVVAEVPFHCRCGIQILGGEGGRFEGVSRLIGAVHLFCLCAGTLSTGL